LYSTMWDCLSQVLSLLKIQPFFSPVVLFLHFTAGHTDIKLFFLFFFCITYSIAKYRRK
jgi:hypothetical protein